MRTAENITQHELIGLQAETGKLTGKVIWETRNTLKLETENGERTVQKKGSTFTFTLGNKKVSVDGNLLLGRPEDRIKKKIR